MTYHYDAITFIALEGDITSFGEMADRLCACIYYYILILSVSFSMYVCITGNESEDHSHGEEGLQKES